MTGVHQVIAGGSKRVPFGIYSGTNFSHNSVATFTGTSGTAAVNGNTEFMSSSVIQPTRPNDLLILSGFAETASGITLPAGWTSLYKTESRFLAYKVSPGGETNSGTISLNSSSRFVSVSYTIRGGNTSSAPEISTIASGTSPYPDSPSISPSWGSSSQSIIMSFITVSGLSFFSLDPPSPPYNAYAGDTNITASNYSTLAGATSRLPAVLASDNPGAWSMSGSRPWVAWTVAARGPNA